jgi:hypothetical protein
LQSAVSFGIHHSPQRKMKSVIERASRHRPDEKHDAVSHENTFLKKNENPAH